MSTKLSLSVLLMVLLASLITVMGQETTDKKKLEEEASKKKEQVTIILDTKKDVEKELQKAMTESLAAEEKALRERKEQAYINGKEYFKQAEALKEYQKKLEEMKLKTGNWADHSDYSVMAPYRLKMDNPGIPNVYSIYSGDSDNTSLSISKTLEDVTFSTDFFYDVKEESTKVSFYVTGTLKAGELKITLKKPDKTAFQEITISPLADVNWNQQFNWDEDETDEYQGKWSISIAASKASGTYKVQVNSR